jgi:hypothetical protein
VKTTTAVTAVAAFAASAGLLNAAPMRADTAADPLPAGQHVLGGPAQIGENTWTVSNLKPSSDTIAYRPAGTLWEATATDEATHSSTTPIVSNFNARAHSGQTYRELFQIASPNGINPAGLAQGQKASGKLYFDVTGDAPDSVTYNAGGPDLALWVQPPPSAGTGGGAHTIAPAGSPATAATPTNSPTAQPAGHPGGSAGTVIPGAAQGTPSPGNAPGSPSPAAGNPASAGTPAVAPGEPSPANPPPVPAPAAVANPGTQLEPGTPVPPSPAAVPAQAGSQGTPLQPGTDQTPTSPANPPPSAAPAANTTAQPAPSPTPAPPAG